MRRFAVIAAAALATAATARAAPPDDAIVVSGQGDARVRSYIRKMARPEPGRQLARWNAPLCIGYDGIAERYSGFIQARIADTARSVGAEMARPGCDAAVLIKLSDQADALTRALVHRATPVIGSLPSRSLPPKRTVAALEAPHVVRWLTASMTTNRDGTQINNGMNRVSMDSLIVSPAREELVSKIILIDAQRLSGVTMNQLADYIAFVTLASPDIAEDFAGSDSIMALFAPGDGARPAGLTRQDRAFLHALYATPSAREARVQQRAIHARMVEAAGDAPDAARRP